VLLCMYEILEFVIFLLKRCGSAGGKIYAGQNGCVAVFYFLSTVL